MGRGTPGHEATREHLRPLPVGDRAAVRDDAVGPPAGTAGAMAWTITLHETDRYAEIATSGVADGEGTMRMARAISQVMAESGMTRLLIDHRRIRAVAGSSTEVYRRPQKLQQMGVAMRVKIAEIVNAEHRPFFDFLETVCVNRGFRFLVFSDRESALAWLLAP